MLPGALRPATAKARRPRGSASSHPAVIEDMIGRKREADRRDPDHVRQRVFLVAGNKQQITASEEGPGRRTRPEGPGPDRLHPRQPLPRQGRRRSSPRRPGRRGASRRRRPGAARPARRAGPSPPPSPRRRATTRASARTRHLDLTDMASGSRHLPDQQLQAHEIRQGPGEGRLAIATGMIEGACRFVIEDRFGITGASMVARTAPRPSSSSAPSIRHRATSDDYTELLQGTLPQRAPPRPLRRGHHRPPQPRRMTETTPRKPGPSPPIIASRLQANVKMCSWTITGPAWVEVCAG